MGLSSVLSFLQLHVFLRGVPKLDAVSNVENNTGKTLDVVRSIKKVHFPQHLAAQVLTHALGLDAPGGNR
jgi:hypothetical protein